MLIFCTFRSPKLTIIIHIMKVKLLFTLLLASFSLILSAQDTKSSCNFKYSVVAEKSPEGLEYEDKFVNFKWDISKLSQSDEVSVEIIKIFDCFTGIDGVQLEKYTLLNLKTDDLVSKSSFKIKHIEMVAKCFKWRVIIKSDTCLEQTDWNYYTYMD